MSWKRALGLALASVALALVIWGVFVAKLGDNFDFAVQPSSAENLMSTIAYTQNVNIAEDGRLMIGHVPTRVEVLATDLEAAFRKAKAPRDKDSQRIVIWASRNTEPHQVDAVRKAIAAGGWTKVSLSKNAAHS